MDKSNTESLTKFKKFVEVYYSLAHKRSGSVYGRSFEDFAEAEKESGFDEIMMDKYINKYSLKKLYSLTQQKTQQNFNKKLEVFNENYIPTISLIKESIKKDSKDNFFEINKYFRDIFNLSHNVIRYFLKNRDLEKVDEIGYKLLYNWSSPETITNEFLMTAFYIANDTYFDKTKKYRYTEDRQKMCQIIEKDSELPKKAKQYLLELPDKITLDNLVEFNNLPQKYDIPLVHANVNGSIAQTLFWETNKDYN